MDTIRLFLALLPDPGITALVQARKDELSRLVGPQQYLIDPPHTTLFLADFPAGKLSSIERSAARCAKSWTAPWIGITGWHTFMNDPLTGNHTLVCRLGVDALSALREIQTDLISQVAPIRDVASSAARFHNQLSGLSPLRKQAIAKTGFPFIGNDWIPHITIASVKAIDWITIEQHMLPSPPQRDGTYATLGLFRLDGGKPSLLADFPLERSSLSPAA